MIRLSKSCISEAEKKAVLEVLDEEFFGMGKKVGQFEERLTEFFGRPAVCVVNGTAALHLALQACGIGRGDEVLVPSLTYVASFQAISATGAIPVACDLDPTVCLLDLEDAEKRITSNTKAIMPVHFTGGVGDLDRVYDFAQKNGLRVVEDAAHAFGTTYRNKRIGALGDIACFSFDGIKNITSGEGGCVVSGDEEVLEKIRDARLLGVEKDSQKRLSKNRSWQFDVSDQGWRYHMSDIMAAIGIKQLERFPSFSSRRKKLCKYYDKILENNEWIKPLPRDYETVVPHIYVVRIPGLENRDQLREELSARAIQTGIHYQPNHHLSFYEFERALNLENTERIFPELITLPLHPDIETKDVEFIVHEFKQALLLLRS